MFIFEGMSKNPFLLYGYDGPEYFCDRESETKHIISALHNGRNITLLSPRRMGKTGLIFHVFDTIQKKKKDTACFYIDIFPTKSLEHFVQALGKAIVGKMDSFGKKTAKTAFTLFKSFRVVLSADPVLGTPQPSIEFAPQETKNTLAEIFSYLKESKRECIIAIDEFQQIVEYKDDGVEALLRSYIQFCPNVHFIFSGSKQHLMTEIFGSASHPFYRSTEIFNLIAIPKEAYFDFAQKWLKQEGCNCSQDVFDKLYEMLEGHTWYMQRVLNALYELAPLSIEMSHVEQSIAQIVDSEKEIYQRLLDSMTNNQCQLLMAIAKEGVVGAINSSAFIHKYRLKNASSISRSLEMLISHEFVTKNANGYYVYDRFMALYLKAL